MLSVSYIHMYVCTVKVTKLNSSKCFSHTWNFFFLENNLEENFCSWAKYCIYREIFLIQSNISRDLYYEEEHFWGRIFTAWWILKTMRVLPLKNLHLIVLPLKNLPLKNFTSQKFYPQKFNLLKVYLSEVLSLKIL